MTLPDTKQDVPIDALAAELEIEQAFSKVTEQYEKLSKSSSLQ